MLYALQPTVAGRTSNLQQITCKTATEMEVVAVITYLFTQREVEAIPGSDSVERTHMVWFAMPVIVKT